MDAAVYADIDDFLHLKILMSLLRQVFYFIEGDLAALRFLSLLWISYRLLLFIVLLSRLLLHSKDLRPDLIAHDVHSSYLVHLKFFLSSLTMPSILRRL